MPSQSHDHTSNNFQGSIKIFGSLVLQLTPEKIVDYLMSMWNVVSTEGSEAQGAVDNKGGILQGGSLSLKLFVCGADGDKGRISYQYKHGHNQLVIAHGGSQSKCLLEMKRVNLRRNDEIICSQDKVNVLLCFHKPWIGYLQLAT